VSFLADYVFNIAKGRVVEFYNRVENNDPTASALILIPLSAQGSEAEAQDYDTVAAVLGGTSDEQTGGGWVRKTLTDTELAALPAPDDTNNRYAVPVPAVTWTTPTAGNNTTGLLIAYDADTAAGTDANLIPLTSHTFTVTTDGNNVVLNVGDFFRAS
jgi:hypothetical protein